jgi:predicted ATPase/DNA-binding SARP family transcriptional activator
MEVGILGPLRVVDGARPVQIGGARLRALLIRLAAGAGGWVSVGELVEDLWESDPPGDEVNALQSLVSRLRRVLPAAGVIESGPAGYRLAVPAESVDGVLFERLAGRGRRLLRDGEPGPAFSVLSEALGLWRGPALVEVAEAGYAMAWAQRLEKLRLTAIEDEVEAALLLGRASELVADLEAVIERHPLRERSHELLIRVLAENGQQAEALAVYERLRRGLVEELGLDPPARLKALQMSVLRNSEPATTEPVIAVPSTTGPPRPAGTDRPAEDRARRTNLRAPLTSFVGRDADLAQLDAAVTRSRLVTLIGPGGAGKTRLAQEAVGHLSQPGRDGVWLVELAPVIDPEDVESSVLGSISASDLQILDRTPTGPRDALTRIVENLAERDVIVILDNCEHLLDAAAKLAEYLLGVCPRLTVLATSREPLGIVGESLWPVAPLESADAVRLFGERGALVRPGFTVTAGNLGSVVEICQRLDGLPLAIELAAARLRNLTVEAIAARLGNRFGLLNAGNRTAMPRHQTLRAVVAWSWDLLTESECRFAEQLSVFPGGATAETAEAICGPSDIVAELLVSLADKSLLVVVEPADGDDGAQPRYRMLETIREFASERLDQRGETAALRAAHARYFLDLVETAEPKLRSREQVSWMARLTAERENLLAVLRFAVEIGDADTAIRLGAGLCWYWTLLGRHYEAAVWLEQALKVPGERPFEGYLLVKMVHLTSAAVSGQVQGLEEHLAEIEVAMAEVELATAHPLMSVVEPGIAAYRNDLIVAQELIERNLNHPDPWGRAMLLLMSGALAENFGDIETMERQFPLALKEFRIIGDRWGIGTAVGALAGVYAARGDVAGAIEALQEARQMLTQMGSTDDEAYALIRIGAMRLRLGDVAGAGRDIEEALAIAERSASLHALAQGTFGLAMVARYEGRAEDARRLAEQALTLIERAPLVPPQLRAGILCGLASFSLTAGATEDAVVRLRLAYQAVSDSRDMPVGAVVATGVADLMLARDQPALAAQLLGAGIRMRGLPDLSDPDVLRVSAAARAGLGTQEYEVNVDLGRNLPLADALALIETSLAG